MILIVTNKQDLTADYVVLELTKRGTPFYRFNTEDFPTTTRITFVTMDGSCSCAIWDGRQKIDVTAVRAAWYRRPGMPRIDACLGDTGYRDFAAAESQALLESFYRLLPCRWLNHPFAIALAESKPYQLDVARRLGFTVPPTVVTSSPEEVRRFFDACAGQVVTKPLKRAVLQIDGGESVIYTSLVLEEALEHLESVRFCPSIFQQQIDKKLDIRVTVVGERVFAVEIDSQAHAETVVDWRRNERIDVPHAEHSLPSEVRGSCLSLVRQLNLKFGAIDLVLGKDGVYYFLEINPNGQWAWMEERLGLPISEAIADELQEEGHDETVGKRTEETQRP